MNGLDRDSWDVSRHAATRALDMQMSLDDIINVLEYPQKSRTIHDEPTHRMITHGKFTALVDYRMTPPKVVTFLWASMELCEVDTSSGANYTDSRASWSPTDNLAHYEAAHPQRKTKPLTGLARHDAIRAAKLRENYARNQSHAGHR